MGRLAILVDKYSVSRSAELEALIRYKQAAEEWGHEAHFLFRRETRSIVRFDAVFIRALTDPLNATYVAARMAEMHGKPVIDDSRSIMICCDKVHMYRRLMAAGVPIPRTEFLRVHEITPARGAQLLAQFGTHVIIKAPSSSFSSHVEKAATPEEFVKCGERFLYRADRIVAQEFVQSTFDWRVGVLGGEPVYACRYVIPDETFKIIAVVDGQTRVAKVEPVPLAEAPPVIVETAIHAANAIGTGLYGVDLKQVNGRAIVIEVNDNPTINADQEDRYAVDVYAKIVRHLLEGPARR